jgi:tetratricopeptide (TPR) repeat protein
MQPQTYNQFFPLIQTWLQQTTYLKQCDFLQAHPELLQPEYDQALMLLVEQNSEKSDVVSGLLSMQQLLHDSRKKGGSAQAIHATYIDWYGAFTLEQPRWLATIIQQVTQLSHKISSKRSLAQRCSLLQRAAARVQRENPGSTELYAECQFFLADTLREYPATNYQHYDAAIASYETACEIYTLPYYPRRFAAIQYTLGNTYYGRLRGDYRINQEQALSSYREALQVYTPQMFPMEWARTLNNLGTVLHIEGERYTNLEMAIAACHAALQIYTREPLRLTGLKHIRVSALSMANASEGSGVPT